MLISGKCVAQTTLSAVMRPLSVTVVRSFISRAEVFSRMLSPGAIAAMNLSGLNCAAAGNLTAPAALLDFQTDRASFEFEY